MKNSNKYRTPALLVSSLVLMGTALSGCATEFGPYAMPSGWTHHGSMYKAPPGPEPVYKRMEEPPVPQLDLPTADNNLFDERTATSPLPPAAPMTGNVYGGPMMPGMQPSPELLQKSTLPQDAQLIASPVALPPNDTMRDSTASLTQPTGERVGGNVYLSVNTLIRNLSFATEEPISAVYLIRERKKSNMTDDLDFAVRNGFITNGIQILNQPRVDSLSAVYSIQKGEGTDDVLKMKLMKEGRILAEESVIMGFGQPAAMPAPQMQQMQPMPMQQPMAAPPRESDPMYSSQPPQPQSASRGPLLLSPR